MVRIIVLRISVALAVALTAGAVLVATGSAATATQDQAVIAGQTNTATSPTVINNTSGTQTCFVPGSPTGLVGCGNTGVHGQGSFYGVYGQGEINGVRGISGTQDGVYGQSFGYGVHGVGDSAGVYGQSSNAGVSGNGGLYGIFGESARGRGVYGLVNNSSTGVVGENSGPGYGVIGSAPNGTGVLADSVNDTALDVRGRSTFTTAGTAVVASGKKKVTVTLAGVTSTDFVLATVQGSGAFYVKNASAAAGMFTITINKPPTAPATVTVAYFVISAS